MKHFFGCYIISSLLMRFYTFSYHPMEQTLEYHVQSNKKFILMSSSKNEIKLVVISTQVFLFIIFISFWASSILFCWTKLPFLSIPNLEWYTCHLKASFLPEIRRLNGILIYLKQRNNLLFFVPIYLLFFSQICITTYSIIWLYV